MPFGTWWRGDFLPDFSPLPPFSARLSTDTQLIAHLTHLPEQEINVRVQDGNHPYIAFMDDTPVAYGWIATQEGDLSGFHFSFPIPSRSCYLWDFQTLPQWRGHSIYPRLLQEIISQEQLVDHFWIGYEPGNEASARGIKKAGFHLEGDLFISEGRVAGLTLFNSGEYAQALADLFHLPIIAGP